MVGVLPQMSVSSHAVVVFVYRHLVRDLLRSGSLGVFGPRADWVAGVGFRILIADFCPTYHTEPLNKSPKRTRDTRPSLALGQIGWFHKVHAPLGSPLGVIRVFIL